MRHSRQGRIFVLIINKTCILAAWLKRELRKFNKDKDVEKLNGDNSHEEKERVTSMFREG